MSRLKRLSYSVSLAVIVTALLISSVDHGGELSVGLLLFPGEATEFILTTLIPHGDGEAYGYTYRGWAANVVIFSFGFYFLLWLYKEIRERRW